MMIVSKDLDRNGCGLIQVLSSNFPGGTVEDRDISHSGQPWTGPKVKLVTSQTYKSTTLPLYDLDVTLDSC
jgi:hypothetical protein